MKAYEYYGEILADGHLSLPKDLKNKLQADSKIRVMLLLDEDEKEPLGSGFGYLDFCSIVVPWHVSRGFIVRAPYTTSCSGETEGRRSFSAKKTVFGSTYCYKRTSSAMDTKSMLSV